MDGKPRERMAAADLETGKRCAHAPQAAAALPLLQKSDAIDPLLSMQGNSLKVNGRASEPGSRRSASYAQFCY